MGAQLPQLKTCCCGCSLRFGCLVVFWLYLISGILWMVSPNISGEYKTNSTVSIVGNTTSTSYHPPNTAYGKVGSVDIINIYPDFGWIAVALGAISTLVAGLGLYGTYKDQHEYIRPFLIWELLDILIVVIGCVRHMILHGFFFYPFFYVLIYGYFWLVIYSHYRVLKGEHNPSTA